jgi:hypothetical protein
MVQARPSSTLRLIPFGERLSAMRNAGLQKIHWQRPDARSQLKGTNWPSPWTKVRSKTGGSRLVDGSARVGSRRNPASGAAAHPHINGRYSGQCYRRADHYAGLKCSLFTYLSRDPQYITHILTYICLFILWRWRDKLMSPQNCPASRTICLLPRLRPWRISGVSKDQ